MNNQEIQSKLKEIIARYVEDSSLLDNIDAETDLLADLKINSAHLVDIILDLEDAFDIEIDDEAAEKMLTVQAAIEIISNQINK